MQEENSPTPQPARQVFLRKDTVIIRWLFGYYDQNRLPGWTTPPQWPHTFSTSHPRKPKTNFREANLVNIDIDRLKEQDGNPLQFHIGVSILRTRDLHNQCDSLDASAEPCIIQSQHWVIGDPNYYSKHEDLFHFGKYRCFPLSKLEQRLRRFIGKSYPSILVVDGGHQEITLLQKLGINLNPILTIDTTKAARYPLQAFYDLSLKRLLQELDVPHVGGHFHTAGNDANFTLRALLMIAVKDARRELGEDRIPPWVPVFEAIARCPLPPVPLQLAQRQTIKRRERKAAAEGNGALS